MRASIGQRNDPRLVLDQWLNPVVDRIEEAANQAGVEVLLEAEVEQHIERVTPRFPRDIGDGAISEPGILGLHRRGDGDALPVALEYGTRLGVAQVGTECVAEARERNTAFSCSRS